MSDEALAETYLDRAQQALDSISDGTHDAQSMRWTVAHALAAAHAAGAAAEKARVVAVLETQMEETRERLRKLSEANSDEYVNVLYELDGLRRFSGKVAQ